MRNTNEILVTTTPFVEGREVKKYLKPVSAHVVAGTNLFSDFFASFSDVFGGRSKTYQRQLSSIYNEAIERLKQTTLELGGDGILGMKVDLDEISGKGKNMFMITATGTAVVFKETTNVVASDINHEKIEIIPSDKMRDLKKSKHLIDLAKNEELSLNDSVWEFITKNQVHEISCYVFKKFKTVFPEAFDKEKLYENFLNYLSSLPEKHRTKLLYEQLMDSSNDSVYPQTLKLIIELMAFDHQLLIKYLQSENIDERKRALQIVAIEKPYYSKEDINIYENLIQIIETNFPPQGTHAMGKGMFSSKEKELWVCNCGVKNPIDSEFCSKCKMDIYGFKNDQINPEKAIKNLKENIEIIANNTY